MLVEWSEKFKTQIPFVDADHKVLVSLLNQVHDCVDQNEETMTLGSVLSALVEYTAHHFTREERLQELCGYSGLESHRSSHRDLTRKVRSFSSRFESDAASVSMDDVQEFLLNWLLDHILISDFAYRDACIGNAEAITEASSMKILNGVGDGLKAPDWGKIRIMVVDDNPNFLLLVQTILKAIGVRSLKAVESGQQGIDWLVRNQVDVVLCDLLMDGMDGAEFVRKFKEMESEGKVIMMSGCAADSLKSKADAIGADGAIEKPITVHGLLETIAGTFPAAP